ncbi:MAG: GNAT family N-acetyltransferase [Armatimonadota bacterium]
MLDYNAVKSINEPCMLANGTNVTMRALNPDDTDAVTEFYGTVPPEDRRFYGTAGLSRKEAEDRVALATNPRFVCLVLETSEHLIAGYAWYYWEKDDSPMSTFGICIRRGYQGVGSGKLLMTRLLKIAKEYGPPAMNLTVQLANNRAIDLYTKMGFTVIREQNREYDGEPEYYMELEVRG